MDYFRVAISTMELPGKIKPGDPIWKSFNGSFENLELSPPALGWMIDEGRAFTTWHANNWRTSANYICGQHLGIDFDTRSVADALADPFVAKYAALVYATPSSTPEAPRSRAVFLLDSPISQPANYVRAASALIWTFGGAADRQCKDAARFFYGSLCSMPTRLDNVLPLAVVRALIADYEALQQRPAQAAPVLQGDPDKAVAGALAFAAKAGEGQRNTSLYWAARRWQEKGVARADAEVMAEAIGRSNGLDDAETLATVRSAYRSR